MNKRDVIRIIFRVVAIFLLSITIAEIPSIIWEWVRMGYVSRGNIVYSSPSFMIVTRWIVSVILPLFFVYLLWNRSGWIADKILAPFGMDELWDDEAAAVEQETPKEVVITHFTLEEIEILACTIIGIWLITSSITRLISDLAAFLNPQTTLYWLIYFVDPLGKAAVGAFLLFRSNHLVSWLSKWRESRMTD